MNKLGKHRNILYTAEALTGHLPKHSMPSHSVRVYSPRDLNKTS